MLPGACKSSDYTFLLAIITGELTGLGKALVSHLSEKGFVVIRGQCSHPLPTVSIQLVYNLRDVKLDLADRTSVGEFSQQLLDQLPYIDLLINSHLSQWPSDTANASSYWRSVMLVDFFAPVAPTQRLLVILQRSSRYSPYLLGDEELFFPPFFKGILNV